MYARLQYCKIATVHRIAFEMLQFSNFESCNFELYLYGGFTCSQSAQCPDWAREWSVCSGRSGWVGKVIVFILMGFSIVSWAMILLKYQFLRKAEKESHAFLQVFRKTKNIEELFKHADDEEIQPAGDALRRRVPGGRVHHQDPSRTAR